MGFSLNSTRNNKAIIRGVASVTASAVGFGLLPLLVTWGAAAGLNIMTLLVLRFALTSCILPLLLRGQPNEKKPDTRTGTLLCILGILFAAQSVLYLVALQRISPGLAVLLHYLYPAFVLLLSLAMRHESPSVRILLPLPIALVGMALTVGSPGAVDVLGVVCAVGCSLVYALYVVLGTTLSARLSSQRLTQYVVVLSATALTVFSAPTGRLDFGFHPFGWLVIVAVALVSTAMPIALFFTGSRVIGATQASIISMVEPVVGVVAAWIVLDAGLTWLQLIGGAILVGAAVLSVYASSDVAGKAPATKDGSAMTIP
ncbi:DMT family transporter [Streptomyces sp. GC420]|uniref:EamA family transporter n=1 Tax=Streptomyces sp. GC420 TaxID=2697568 RepID=UPI001414FD48|nr:EamA family transporter [Streptomyces sp. GC420]NBM15560.1 EamA family transporter [Streptomyces sp. GC420]